MPVWQELSGEEERIIWNIFFNQFKFSPSIQQLPAIQEPAPSITCRFRFSDVTAETIRDLHLKMLSAFRHSVPENGRLYALDWQHPCYWLYPHNFKNAAQAEAWKIPVLPDGDFYIFLAQDFKFGVFGHPWEETICIFGESLVEAIRAMPPVLLKEVVRVNEGKGMS